MQTALKNSIGLAVWMMFPAGLALAGQGAGRMLYTAPNMAFIEQPLGDSVVTINDTSGSIATLQTVINNARSANPNSIIVIQLSTNASYLVSTAGLVLGSQECLVAGGATIKAVDSSVTVPLITIASGSTNVSVAGGLLDASGAGVQGIYAPAAARVNIDKVVVRNCGLDCILLQGNGNSAYDNEMTVTRCDVSGSPAHAGISIQNSTQTAVLENFCHNNGQGIWLSCAWADVANNVCESNAVGIDVAGGDDDVLANNTCNNNGTGIVASGSNNMIVSDAVGGNSTAGISSSGSGSTFADNLFTSGNAVNFSSGGSGNHVIAYQVPLSASGQDYFYPPLINDQHAATIVNGMGRTDLTISSTTIDNVQSQYNSARASNPNNVIVLHLNGNFTVVTNALTLQSNTCVLLNGTIQINSATTATAAITGGATPVHVSISGGTIDGGGLTGNNGVYIPGGSMLQLDSVTLQSFGPDNPRVGGSDVVRFTGGATPQIITRCFINGGAARAIWLENSGVKRVVSDCQSTAVNMDGVDCDASTSGSIVKFCYCHDLVRYGVFIEQSASHNVALGNVCTNCGREINLYNNSATPRGDTAFNSVLCNWLMGNNGLRNGSTGTNVVQTTHNFLFNNTIINADIESQTYGTQNYYSQNYLLGGALSTAGVEVFFNSPDVSSNLFVQDSNSGLAVLVRDAATTNGAQVVIGSATGLGNDLWALVPTDSGYYQIKIEKSGLDMNVSGASSNSGAPIIQWPFGSGQNDQWMPLSAGNGLYYVINRRSGLCLDVPGGSFTAGTQLDQQPYSGGANQQFNLTLTPPTAGSLLPFFMTASPGSQTVPPGGSTAFSVGISTNSNFTGSLAFSVSGLPTNVDATFNPPVLNGAGSAALTITTSNTTPAGVYTLTLAGAGDSLTNFATVTLIVARNPANLVWDSTSSDVWDVTNSYNWFDPALGGADQFYNGDSVLFGDTPGVITNVTIPAGVLVMPAAITNNSSANNFTIGGAGDISGTAGIVKAGNSTLTLDTANDFTGSVTILAGTVKVGSATALGNAGGETFISNNGTLDINGQNLDGELVTVSGPGGGGQGAIINSGPQQTSALRDVTLAGDTTFGGTGRWDIRNSGGTASLNTSPPHSPFNLVKVGTNQVSLVGVSSIDPALGDIDVRQGEFAIQTSTTQVGNPANTITVHTNATLDFYTLSTPLNKNTVVQDGGTIFNEKGPSYIGGGATITLEGNAYFDVTNNGTPPSLNCSNVITGPGNLIVTGGGTLTLGGTNIYTGSTLVTTGTLALAGMGSISDSPLISVAPGATIDVSSHTGLTFTLSAGQTLTGGGAVNRSLTVNSNAVVSPGNDSSVGVLTVGNGAFLQGTMMMKLNKTARTNDVISAGSLITFAGGILQVTNLSGTLTATDTFKLFNALAYGVGGSLPKMVPAIPGLNLAWDTGTLALDGTLRITNAPTPPPVISAVALSGSDLVFTGSNGVRNWTYYLLASTNMAAPPGQWLRVATNVFDDNGNFNFTNSFNLNTPQIFYLLQLQ